MRYLRFYREFREYEIQDIEVAPEHELTDTTIEDVLDPDFFKDVESDDEVNRDDSGVYHIKSWKVY